MDPIDDLANRIEGADHVRAVRERHDPGSLVQQLVQIGQVQLAGVRIDAPLANDIPVVRKPTEGADIGLVIEVGHHHLVAGLQRLAEGLAENVGVLRRRWTKNDFVVVHIEPIGHALPGLIHLATRFHGSVRPGIGLNLVGNVVPVQTIDYGAAGIGTPCVLEVGPVRERRFLEGRELRTDETRIQWHGCTLVEGAEHLIVPAASRQFQAPAIRRMRRGPRRSCRSPR